MCIVLVPVAEDDHLERLIDSGVESYHVSLDDKLVVTNLNALFNPNR